MPGPNLDNYTCTSVSSKGMISELKMCVIFYLSLHFSYNILR